MSTILAYASNIFVVCTIAFVAGVILSQKVKDWLAGVPADLRTGLKGVEKRVIQEAQAARMRIIAELPLPAAKVAPVDPVLQPAPLAPVPVPVPEQALTPPS